MTDNPSPPLGWIAVPWIQDISVVTYLQVHQIVSVNKATDTNTGETIICTQIGNIRTPLSVPDVLGLIERAMTRRS